MWLCNLRNDNDVAAKITMEMVNEKKLFDNEHQLPSTSILSDSTATLSLATSSHVSAKCKHVETKYNHVRSLIEAGSVELHNILTSEHVADVFTKPVAYKILRPKISTNGKRKFLNFATNFYYCNWMSLKN